MKLSAAAIRKLYSGGLPEVYDERLSAAYDAWKESAVGASSLQEGDRVIVFCCGAGHDFPHVLKRIGARGRIVGVDFSRPMLERARERARREGWANIELIEADVTEFAGRRDVPFDAGVCTLGMSIIPQYQKAYANLLSHVKAGGEVIIGDMQLAAGWRSLLNPRIVRLGREFGGTYRGYRNCRRLFALMKRELADVRTGTFFHRSYCYCIGRKRRG
jgi:demethylmenaquinone methyltransferase/2-methoxy-6-polyprenyl-1,4-benzoquinol methylase